MDLKAFTAGEAGEIMGAKGGFGGIAQRDFAKPLIAAVNGSALAGGCEIMLSCDLVVAVEEATFGIPEVKRGLMAGAGGLIRLPKRIPPAIALELALTGDPIDAQRALALGLINRVVPADKLMDEALALAEHHRRQRPPGRAGLQAGDEAGRRAARRRGVGYQQRGGARGVRLGRRHGGAHRLRREAQAQLVGHTVATTCVRPPPPAVDGRRSPPMTTVTLVGHAVHQPGPTSVAVRRPRRLPADPPRLGRHHLGGRQFTVAGLLPTVSTLGEEAPKKVARALGRLLWPAYAVLVVTGFWNIGSLNVGTPRRPGRPCCSSRSPWWPWPGRRSTCISGPEQAGHGRLGRHRGCGLGGGPVSGGIPGRLTGHPGRAGRPRMTPARPLTQTLCSEPGRTGLTLSTAAHRSAGQQAAERRRHTVHFGPPSEIFGVDGIIILVVVVLVLFGSTQIPKLARSLGSAQKEFKKGLDEGSADDGKSTASVAQAAPPAR